MNTTTSLTNTVNVPQTAVRPATLRRRRAAESGNLWTRSLLLGGILSLSSGLLAPAQAQTQTISKKVDFNTTNQSLWGANPNDPTKVDSINYNPFSGINFQGTFGQFPTGIVFNGALTASWNTGNVGKSAYPVSGTGGEVTTNTAGKAGIGLSAWANSGSVDLDYNGYIVLLPPTNLQPGQAFTIPSQWSGQGTMTTHSPQVGVTVQGLINASASASIKAKSAGNTFLNKSASANINETLDIFSVDNISLGGSFDFKEKGILTVSGHAPLINTQGNGTYYFDLMGHLVTTPITSSGSDTFLTIDGDITALLTTLLEEADIPVPPLKVEDSESLKDPVFHTTVAKATADYNLLDLYGELSLTGEQDFSFTATPTITLTFTAKKPNGMILPAYVVSFPAGTTPTITLPTSFTGQVSVQAMADVATNKFTNNTSLILNPGLYFLPIETSVSGSVVGISFPSIDFKPVDTIDLISQEFPISLFNQTFTLGGFTPQALPGFTINVSN